MGDEMKWKFWKREMPRYNIEKIEFSGLTIKFTFSNEEDFHRFGHGTVWNTRMLVCHDQNPYSVAPGPLTTEKMFNDYKTIGIGAMK